jgi:hypothetical protein
MNNWSPYHHLMQNRSGGETALQPGIQRQRIHLVCRRDVGCATRQVSLRIAVDGIEANAKLLVLAVASANIDMPTELGIQGVIGCELR